MIKVNNKTYKSFKKAKQYNQNYFATNFKNYQKDGVNFNEEITYFQNKINYLGEENMKMATELAHSNNYTMNLKIQGIIKLLNQNQELLEKLKNAYSTKKGSKKNEYIKEHCGLTAGEFAKHFINK